MLLNTYHLHPRRAEMMGVAAGELRARSRSVRAAPLLPRYLKLARQGTSRNQYFMSICNTIDLPGHYEHLRFTKIGIVYRPVDCFRVCVRRGFHCVCSSVLEPLWSWLVLRVRGW